MFSPFYKAKDNNLGDYTRYLATKYGVQLPENTKLNLPVTKNQTALIEKMLNDFPESRNLHEYADYKEEQTIGNASD